MGYFATPEALEAAYPIGWPGAFAVVGSTDTIWVWDEDTMMWVDTGNSPFVPFTFVDSETPSGTLNGTNKIFTLANNPDPDLSLMLFKDGALQTSGGVDYTLVGDTITFVIAPRSTSIVRAWYRY